MLSSILPVVLPVRSTSIMRMETNVQRFIQHKYTLLSDPFTFTYRKMNNPAHAVISHNEKIGRFR